MRFGQAGRQIAGAARMKRAVYTFVLVASTAGVFLTTGSWWNVRSRLGRGRGRSRGTPRLRLSDESSSVHS